MAAIPIDATISHIHRELGSRGYVYAVIDTLCGTAFVVSQKLPQIVDFLNQELRESFSTSSLYEAATIRRGLHRHRWRVLRLDLADAQLLSRLEAERNARTFERSVALGAPHAYRVSAGAGIAA